MKFIAEKLGFPLEETEFSRERVSKNNKYYEINSLAAKYYFKNLLTEDFPQEYMGKRGLSKKILNKYFLGYAKNDNGLYRFLKERGFEENDMIHLGLIGESNGRYYDKFRDRLIFPILNNKNKVIGFGGRTLIDHNIKYLNSPESDVFIKGKNIYGVNVVNRSKKDKIILVEGYMDVIGLYNQGIDYVVATLGTALTEDQARLIKRYASQIYLAYDGDNAGIKATLRAIDIFKNMEVQLSIMEFPDKMDPDEYVKSYGKEAFEKLMRSAVDPIDFKLNKLSEKATSKMDFIRSIIEFLASIEGNVVRDLYIDKAAKFIGVATDSLRNDVNQVIEKDANKEKYKHNNFQNENIGYQSNKVEPVKENIIEKKNHKLELEKEMIIYSLLDKDYFNMLKNKRDFLENNNLIQIYDKIETCYANNSPLESILEMDAFKNEALSANYYQTKKEKHSKSVVEELLNRIERNKLKDRLSELKTLVSQKRFDANIMKEYTDLLRKLT